MIIKLPRPFPLITGNPLPGTLISLPTGQPLGIFTASIESSIESSIEFSSDVSSNIGLLLLLSFLL